MGRKLKRDYQCGFDNLTIEAPLFAKLLALNVLRWTNRKTENGAFVWGFDDGHIVTYADPLTGASAYNSGSAGDIGFANEVGVEGTKSFRDRVAKFLKRNAAFQEFDPSTRRFI